MTSRIDSTITGVDRVWQVLDAQVEDGRMPGYVAALRVRGREHVRAGGRTAVEPDSSPMRENDTQFRIASITKPIGAALTLTLVRDGVVTLDDPIARWLPEAAEPRVLRSPGAALDQVVPAERPVTVRDLLAGTSGWGVVMDDTPLRAAMIERDVYGGPLHRDVSPDEFVERVTNLPLAFQPGAGWLYETGIDLLGMLLMRATGRSLADLFAERITGPLGLASTGFIGDPARLATAYLPGPDGLEAIDPPGGTFAVPPPFEELSSGLVSTAPDLLRFFCAMADGGAPVLTADEVALMTADALTPEQRRSALAFLDPGESWGLGTGVDVEAVQPWQAPGRWGWTGGTGTTAYVDPVRGTVAVLLTQRAMTGPNDGFDDFWTTVAAAA
jgi:CubicO group peptidase (beta-lactamase class C family)